MRIRLTKDHKQNKKGDIVEVSRNEAFHLIDSGLGMVSKDMTERDTRTRRKK